MQPEQQASAVPAKQSTYIRWPLYKTLGVACGDFGRTFTNVLFSSYSSIFLTDVFGLTPLLVSALQWISKLWDAINDIMIGVWADRTVHRLGRYRPWMRAAIIPMILATVLCFISFPDWSMGAKYAWAFVTYCVYTFADTCFYVPYSAMQITLTQDPDERAKISGIRISLGVAAAWVVGTYTVPLAKALGHGSLSVGYPLAALVFGLIGAPFVYLSYRNARENIRPANYDTLLRRKEQGEKLLQKKVKIPFKRMLHSVSGNTPMKIALIGMLLNGFLTNGRNTTIVYYFTYSIGKGTLNAGLLAMFMLALRIPMFLGNFSSGWIVKKFRSKGRVVSLMFTLMGIILFVTAAFDPLEHWGLFLLLTAALNYCQGVGHAQSLACGNDAVEYGEYLTGDRFEGFMNSFVSFFNKVGIAFGISSTTIVLSLTGYVPNTVQNARVLAGLNFSMYYLPASMAIITGIVFLFYKLDNTRFESIVAEIQKRRAEKGSN